MLVPGMAAAKESYDASQAQYRETAEELNKVYLEMKEIKVAYNKAVEAGDTEQATALLRAGEQASAKYALLEGAAESAKRSYDLSVKELDKAERSGQYLWGVLGLVLSAGTAVAGKIIGAKKPTAALESVSGALEEMKAGTPWATVAPKLATELTNNKSFNLVEKIRP